MAPPLSGEQSLVPLITALEERSRPLSPSVTAFVQCSNDVLAWRNARAEDRPLLRAFRCTYPAFPVVDEETGEEFHDYPWELEVQRHLNRLHPLVSPPSFLFLGFHPEDATLDAVIELIVTQFDRYCFIPAVAVSHQRSGNGLAGEAIDRVQNLMTSYGIDDDYIAEARIDPDNWSAKSCFEGRGFTFLERVNGYETWARHY